MLTKRMKQYIDRYAFCLKPLQLPKSGANVAADNRIHGGVQCSAGRIPHHCFHIFDRQARIASGESHKLGNFAFRHTRVSAEQAGQMTLSVLVYAKPRVA